jgi:hypothetical protein
MTKKLIDVHDGLFTHHERTAFLEFIKNSFFKTSGTDNPSVYGNIEQIYSRYTLEDTASMGFLNSPQVKNLYKKYDLNSHRLHQVRVNLTTNSEKNLIHTDRKGLTLLYYANVDWKLEWGGHTLFMDDKLEEVETVTLYKPGRIVVFDGTIPHMIMTPSNLCPTNRYSLVMQFEKISLEMAQ